MDEAKYSAYLAVLTKRLSDRRLRHSLCVADSARHLAEKFGADADVCFEAGLLHDVLKEAKADEIFALCRRWEIALTPLEKVTPKLWHAKVGAVFLEKELGVTDARVISAVRYHTTAKADMSPEELTLFVADFVSADRDYPDVDVIRAKSERDPEDAAVYGLAYTIRELAQEERPIHPDTLEAYNDLILKRNPKG